MIPKMPTKKEMPTKKVLTKGDKEIIISTDAYLKGVVLGESTSTEWSGYGPITKNGTGSKWVLHDLYYLSNDDSGGETNLGPEATAESWMRVMESELNPADVKLAWVHCHPSGGRFWSGTDDVAIIDSLKMQGTPGASQISILFATGQGIMARYDTHDVMESMIVMVDYGEYQRDVDRAVEHEVKYLERVVARRAAAQAQPRYLEPDDDDTIVNYIYHCDICDKELTVNKPYECVECHFWVCEDHVAIKDEDWPGNVVCTLCGGDPEEAKNFLLDKYEETQLNPGDCLLCGLPTDNPFICQNCMDTHSLEKGMK